MKALIIEEPGLARLGERSTPAVGPGEVLIRVQRAGYCGSDLSTFRGLNPLVSYPRVPGHELAGTIEQADSSVPAEWRPGRQVLVIPYTSCGYCSSCRRGRTNCCRHNETLGVQRDGGMCEFIAVPWQKLMAHEALGLAELALVEPLTVGFHAVSRARVGARDMVVVLGCGAIGLGAIAGAAARGARVIAVDLDESKADVAAATGAMRMIQPDSGNLAEEVLEASQGQGADVVFEAVGNPSTFRMAVDLAAFAGRVVYIGYTKLPVEYDTRQFVQKELDILGSRNALPADFDAVVQHLASGRFPVNKVISRVEPLGNAVTALSEWAAHPQTVTKIQINLDL